MTRLCDCIWLLQWLDTNLPFFRVSTAEAIYEACDGTEYEKSSNVIDLRFVPDDVTFDDEPTDTADTMPDATTFEPSEYDAAHGRGII